MGQSKLASQSVFQPPLRSPSRFLLGRSRKCGEGARIGKRVDAHAEGCDAETAADSDHTEGQNDDDLIQRESLQ